MLPVNTACDCYQCDAERTDPYHDRKEAPVVSKQLTCTCASRYVRDGDHESDCDLWLIDEFWAGFLAWDWNEECLVKTHMYPSGHVPEDDSAWVNEYLAQKDEQQMVEDNLRDRDIALTTDMFIDRMIEKFPEDKDLVWSKGDDGMWTAATQTGKTYKQTGTYPGSSSAHTYDEGWSNDWSQWASDRHTATEMVLPDEAGTVVTATSACNQYDRPTPDFGLYLDRSWKPDGMAIMLPWQDFGLPNVSHGFADYAIQETYAWAVSGALVEVGCIGGHGRTGTVLACMALLADPTMSGEDAVWYVRGAYCKHAIETKEQEWYVERFAATMKGEPEPERPKAYVHTPQVVATKATPKAEGTWVPMDSPSGGRVSNPEKPRSKAKARRSKRGGKRQRNHRNRMASR